VTGNEALERHAPFNVCVCIMSKIFEKLQWHPVTSASLGCYYKTQWFYMTIYEQCIVRKCCAVFNKILSEWLLSQSIIHNISLMTTSLFSVLNISWWCDRFSLQSKYKVVSILTSNICVCWWYPLCSDVARLFTAACVHDDLYLIWGHGGIGTLQNKHDLANAGCIWLISTMGSLYKCSPS